MTRSQQACNKFVFIQLIEYSFVTIVQFAISAIKLVPVSMVYFYNIQHCHCCIISIAAFFLSCIHWRRKEPTSLSYMYGPDHELSNLRDAYRHAHANNPHYTWFVFNSCMIMILCCQLILSSFNVYYSGHEMIMFVLTRILNS